MLLSPRPFATASFQAVIILFAPRPFDLSDYLSRLSADVGHAILTVAIVEEWLEALLLQHLQLDEVGVARHFGDYGPLNSFGKKITKAHDLLLIDEDTRRDSSRKFGARSRTQRGISTSTAVPWRGC